MSDKKDKKDKKKKKKDGEKEEEKDILLNWAKTNDNNEIYYEDKGKGPIIVFQSGFFGVTDIWEDIVKELKEDFRCITHDNRGYGRSSVPNQKESYSIERHADDLKDLLDHLKINEPVYLISHSIGCFILSAFASKYPQLAKRLIFLGGYISGFTNMGPGLDDFSAYEKSLEFKSQRADFYHNIGLKYKIAQEATKWDSVGLLNNARMISEKNLDRYYPKINVEVLLINGEKDVAYQKVEGNDLKGSIEKSVAIWIKDVNHFVQVENPSKTVELIKKNLEVNPLNSLGDMIV